MAETVYDIGNILEIMPHRYPFLLVDRILEVTPGESIVGLKNVTFNEEFFQGHFPRLPVMPGVLILEAMAQTGGILAWASAEEKDRNRMLYFMSIDKAKFRRPVVPGDQLILKLSGFRTSSRAIKMEGQALVEGKLAAQAQLTAAIGDVYQKN